MRDIDYKTTSEDQESARGSDPRASENEGINKTTPALWSSPLKATVFVLILVHSLMASWCAASFIPAFKRMATEFHTEIDTISYLVGGYTLLLGFGVLVWNPLSEVIGRRPTVLLGTAVAIASTCGTAVAPTYGTLMTARIFQGFGMAVITSLGPDYIHAMFAARWRGVTIGLWTLALTIGPFIGPLASGFISRSQGWRWIQWTEAIILAILFLGHVVLLPESVPGSACDDSTRHLLQLPRARLPPQCSQRLATSGTKLVSAVCSPVVWLTGLAFSVQYGYVAVSMSSLFPIVYGKMYHFGEAQQGLLYLPMLIGSVIAELFTGSLGDLAVARAQNAKRTPEARLLVAIPGCILAMAGMLWFGVSVQQHRHWIVPAVGSGCAALGIQSVISICFSYAIDCHGDKAKEVATIMNLFRVLSSFIVLFYNQPLVERAGYGWGFGAQVFIVAFFDCGLVLLWWRGPLWRQ